MPERTHTEVGNYYDQEIVSAEATGAGLIWFMGKDHLSPPLSNLDKYALDSSQWREASSQRVVSLAERMNIRKGDTVLELGCGIGGPGRDITEATDATVVGLSISEKQLQNLQRLSQEVQSPYIDVIKGDMQNLPFGAATLDHIYSINAVYHVNDPEAVVRESYRSLKPDGQLGIDDWFVTNSITNEEHEKLRFNWSTSSHGFHNFDRFAQTMEESGFIITDIKDFTKEAGEFLSEDRFGDTYDAQIAPVLMEAFPRLYQYNGYTTAHATMAVTQLRSDILYMGELYRSGSAVYRQIIGKKY